MGTLAMTCFLLTLKSRTVKSNLKNKKLGRRTIISKTCRLYFDMANAIIALLNLQYTVICHISVATIIERRQRNL